MQRPAALVFLKCDGNGGSDFVDGGGFPGEVFKNCRVNLFDPVTQVLRVILFQQGPEFMGPFVPLLPMTVGDPPQFLPRLLQTLSHTDMTIQGRTETGFVLPPFAVEKQRAFTVAEKLEVTGNRFGPRQFRGSQMKIVIGDPQTGKVDLSASTIGGAGAAKVDGSADLQGLQHPFKPAGGS